MISFLISSTQFLKIFRYSFFSANYWDFNFMISFYMTIQLDFRFCFETNLGLVEVLLKDLFLGVPYFSQIILRTVSTLTIFDVPICSSSFSLILLICISKSDFLLDYTLRLKVLPFDDFPEVKGLFSPFSLFSAVKGLISLDFGVEISYLLFYDLLSLLQNPSSFIKLFSPNVTFTLAASASNSLFLLVKKQIFFQQLWLSPQSSLIRTFRSNISLSLLHILSKSFKDSFLKMMSSFSKQSILSRQAFSLLALLRDCFRISSISSLTFFICRLYAVKNSASWLWTMSWTRTSTQSIYLTSSQCESFMISSLLFRDEQILLFLLLALTKLGDPSVIKLSSFLDCTFLMRSMLIEGWGDDWLITIKLILKTSAVVTPFLRSSKDDGFQQYIDDQLIRP